MIGQVPLLFLLVRLVDHVPAPPPADRGRAKVSSGSGVLEGAGDPACAPSQHPPRIARRPRAAHPRNAAVAHTESMKNKTYSGFNQAVSNVKKAQARISAW